MNTPATGPAPSLVTLRDTALTGGVPEDAIDHLTGGGDCCDESVAGQDIDEFICPSQRLHHFLPAFDRGVPEGRESVTQFPCRCLVLLQLQGIKYR